jgi:hypothetical protein
MIYFQTLAPRDWCYDFKNIFTKNGEQNGHFSLKAKINYAKNWSLHRFFEKNGNFFAEHGQKSRKIVIITLAPGTVSEAAFTSAAYSRLPAASNPFSSHSKHSLFDQCSNFSRSDPFKLKKKFRGHAGRGSCVFVLRHKRLRKHWTIWRPLCS